MSPDWGAHATDAFSEAALLCNIQPNVATESVATRKCTEAGLPPRDVGAIAKSTRDVVDRTMDANGYRYLVEWTVAPTTHNVAEMTADSHFGILDSRFFRSLYQIVGERGDIVVCTRPVYKMYIRAHDRLTIRCHSQSISNLRKETDRDIQESKTAFADAENGRVFRLLRLCAKVRKARFREIIDALSRNPTLPRWATASEANILDACKRSDLDEVVTFEVKKGSSDVGVILIENVHIVDVLEIYSVMRSVKHATGSSFSFDLDMDAHERWIKITLNTLDKRGREVQDRVEMHKRNRCS
ncbi:hypothetical protein CYMTET_47698 [Cymbomonas tetramitiformis]|uniref:Uncharacterized protein n=1 Tax=Cymbomonas tetramitiformis TaxID=36881 RepID=A0AAE0BV31_9CHLO|nr:hypothetical protein CYMTET_47698 [Cymbomonas tetramitiformis]